MKYFENRTIKKGIEMLKSTLYRSRSYKQLEKLGIEDIMTDSDTKIKINNDEFAIIIKKPNF